VVVEEMRLNTDGSGAGSGTVAQRDVAIRPDQRSKSTVRQRYPTQLCE
jgi:hypothetical protein